VSNGTDLAAALASRILAQSDGAAVLAGVLGPAFDSLDALLSKAGASFDVTKIQTLLYTSTAASPPSADQTAARLGSCLPVNPALLAGLLWPDAGAASKRQQLAKALVGKTPATTVGQTQPRSIFADFIKLVNAESPQSAVAVTLWGILQSFSNDAMTFVATVPPPNWRNPASIVELIRKQIARYLDKLNALGGLTPRTQAVADLIKLEIEFRLPVRLTVAGAFSAGSASLTGFGGLRQLLSGKGSNPSLGTAVHLVLQEEYRDNRPMNLIEQDNTVYYTLPLRRYQLPLQDAVVQLPQHDELTALFVARQSLKLVDAIVSGAAPDQVKNMTGWSIEDDNTDLSAFRIWEIKPGLGAFMAVVQEFYYRSTYNLAIAFLRDMDDVTRTAFRKLLRQKPQSPIQIFNELLYSGTPAFWPEINTPEGGARLIETRTATYTVLIVQLDALSGIVLYWNVEFPLAALALAYNPIKEWLNKQANNVQTAVIEVLTWVTAIAIAIVVVLLILLVAVVAADAAAAVIGALGISATTAAEIMLFIKALQSLDQSWTISLAEDASLGRVAVALQPSGSLADDVLVTNTSAGFLQIQGVPLEAAQHLAAVIQGGFEGCRSLLSQTANA
jgi:hypothetical protein